ncbi:MAG TPA: hypothetical protein VFF06_00385 [Polyangia bacterium]|nr:hypothetical protein [Polyangia bacterium]
MRCRRIAGGSARLESLDAAARLAYLRENLRRGARHVRAWHYAWSGIYGALTTYQLVLIPFGDREQRIDYYFGASSALLGFAVLWIAPLKVMRDQRWLERRIAAAPPGESPCAPLADAERLLLRDAASEAFGKSALVHAGNVALNVGLLLALGFGFGHWQQAAIQGPVGIVVGELQIFSQPRDEMTTLARYRSGQLTPAPRERYWLSVVPDLSRDRAGLSLTIDF